MTPRTREKLDATANFCLDMALPVAVLCVLIWSAWPW